MAADRVLNVCFHGIGDPQREREPGEDRYWITVDTYHRILDSLVDRDDVVLSFDDGNITDLEVGLPALVDRGLSATFFPLAGRLGQGGSLSGDALRELRRHGMRIGSHGMDHIPWRRLGETETRRELVVARERLAEASDGPIREAALPLGRYDRRLLAQLRRLDYEHVYSSDRAPASRRTWLQARYSVRADDTPESFLAELGRRRPLQQRLRAAGVRLVKRLR